MASSSARLFSADGGSGFVQAHQSGYVGLLGSVQYSGNFS
jgi:hypothetical protein